MICIPTSCWYNRDGTSAKRVKAIMLEPPSDRTLILLETGELKYAKVYELVITGADDIFGKFWKC